MVPLMSPWLDLSDLLRLAQTNKACMRDIEIGVREIGLTEFEDPPTGRITDAVIASISRRFPSLRVLYLHQCVDITDAAVRHLACLPQLRELTISGCDVTSAGLSVLSDTCLKASCGNFRRQQLLHLGSNLKKPRRVITTRP